MQGLRTVKGHGQACAGSLSAEMLADRKMSFPPPESRKTLSGGFVCLCGGGGQYKSQFGSGGTLAVYISGRFANAYRPVLFH